GVPLVDANRKLLFVSNQGLQNVPGDTMTAFAIGGNALSPVSGTPFAVRSGAAPMGMAMTRSGQFLLTADYPGDRGGAASIAIFTIGVNGSLATVQGSPFPVGASSLTSL